MGTELLLLIYPIMFYMIRLSVNWFICTRALVVQLCRVTMFYHFENDSEITKFLLYVDVA